MRWLQWFLPSWEWFMLMKLFGVGFNVLCHSACWFDFFISCFIQNELWLSVLTVRLTVMYFSSRGYFCWIIRIKKVYPGGWNGDSPPLPKGGKIPIPNMIIVNYVDGLGCTRKKSLIKLILNHHFQIGSSTFTTPSPPIALLL